MFIKAKGKSCPWLLNGADFFLNLFIFCLNPALGGNLQPRAILKRAIWITKWSL